MGSIPDSTLDSAATPTRRALPTVYSRDFAYADNAPIVVVPTRMACADVLKASAKTYADIIVTITITIISIIIVIMTASTYLGHSARSRLLELGGRSPSYSDAVNDDEAENLRKRLLSGPTVDILVGPEKKQWSLHRNLLCHHSSYFENEFIRDGGSSRNAFEKDYTLELPDNDPRGFELLVKWLYQGQLDDASQLPDDAKYDYAVACHKLHLLCDKFDMVKLKNLAMDQYRQCLNECQLVPDAEEINEIYRTSPVDSPFRPLMVKIAARQIMDPETDRDAEAYRECFESNPDFAVEMVNAIRYMSGGILFDDPTFADFCSYHDHDDVSDCRVQRDGKAKANGKARAINGQGFPTSAAAQQQYMALPVVAELSSERRTPRKLNTPSTSPAVWRNATSPPAVLVSVTPARAAVRTPVSNTSQRRRPLENGHHETQDRPIKQTSSAPRRLPLKLEKRVQLDATPVKSQMPTPDTVKSVLTQTSPANDGDSPFDRTAEDPVEPYGTHIRMLAPKGIAPNPSELSPLVSRSTKRIPMAVTNVEYLLPPIVSPSEIQSTAKADGNSITKLTSQRLKTVPQRPKPSANGQLTTHASSVASTDLDLQSTTSSRSRKRKLEHRASPGLKIRHPTASSVHTVEQHSGAPDSHRRSSENIPSSHSSTSGGPRKLSRINTSTKSRAGAQVVTTVDRRKDTSSTASRSKSGQTGGPAELANGRRPEKKSMARTKGR